MSDSFIQVQPDSSGKKVDTEQLTVNGQTVEREREQIAGKADTEIVEVKNAEPSTSHHGMVTREAPKPIERLRQQNTGAQTNQIIKTVIGGEIFVITAYSIWVSPKCSVDVDVLLELGTTPCADYEKLPPGTFIAESDSGGLMRGIDGDDLLLTNTVPSDGSVVVHASGYIV